MKKVLVVDNHPVMLKFMNNLLEKRGHQALTAGDGLEALEILKTYTPDIIFVDLVMPNISGEKLCRIIRSMPELKDVYLVILSAIAGEKDMDLAEIGVDACIAKGPFNKVSEHVLTVLDQLDRHGSGGGDLPEITLGLEDDCSGEITVELLSAKRHFEAILNALSEGILELNLDAKILYANPVAASLFGISEEKLLTSNLIELFRGTNRSRIKDLLDTVADAPQTVVREFSVNLNGKQFSLNILPVKDDEKKSIIVILSDITGQKQIEAQLRQAQKMEALGTLASGIAHNFNNLLMGIQGNASLMLLGAPSDHSSNERLLTIEKLVQNGSKLTSQLLVYAREGRYEVKPVNLNKLVKKISDTFGMTRKEMRVHRELAEDLFSVKADEGQIEQVLLNVFVNSADAMPKGGELILRTRNVTQNDIERRHPDKKELNYALLTVTDNGVGMDGKTKERIFEPFFTTKDMGRGTGLGLATAYGIINDHGGYMEVDSEIAKGTTFSIYMPAIDQKVQKKGEDSEKIIEGSETIMIVDDEEMVLDVSVSLLERLGYDVLMARGGREAIELYQEKEETIDMVILDMVMPDLGGGEAYDMMKEINSGVKVLLSSGYRIDGQATEILNRGCNGFIQKPFNINQLSRVIREVLD